MHRTEEWTHDIQLPSLPDVMSESQQDEVPLLSLKGQDLEGAESHCEPNEPLVSRRLYIYTFAAGLLALAITFGTFYAFRPRTLPPYDSIVIFGDSFTGYMFFGATEDERSRYSWDNCPPPPKGRTTGGRAWPELLRDRLNPETSIVNLALGGANCAGENAGTIVDMDRFQRQGGLAVKHPENTLAIIFDSSSNDIFPIYQALRQNASSASHLPTTLALVDCSMNKIQGLYESGLTKFLVFQFFPLYVMPLMYTTDSPDPMISLHLNKMYNQDGNRLLKERLQDFQETSDAHVQLFPISDLFLDLVNHPQPRLNVTTPTCLNENGILTQECESLLVSRFTHISETTYQVLLDDIVTMVTSRTSRRR